MFKINNRNIRTSCEIYSKLTIKTPEQCQWRRSGVSILVFLFLSRSNRVGLPIDSGGIKNKLLKFA